jgi:hypothetical protein
MKNTIEFRTSALSSNDWIMRITEDKRIEVNEGVEVNEAAQKVLVAMQPYLNMQKRTWVGLTDEEKTSFWTADQMTQEEWDKLFAAIEAKLKEKNT